MSLPKLLAALFVVAVGSGATSLWGQSDLEQLPLDELLRRLPRTGKERGENWTLHPVADELRKRLENGVVLSADQWRSALIGTKAIRIRDRWPADEPLALSMVLPGWLGKSQIRMEPAYAALSSARVGSLFPSHCGNCSNSQRSRALYQEIGRLQAGSYTLEFDVIIERAKEFRTDMSVPPIWRGSMTFDVDVVDTVDQAIPPVVNDELDEAVRRSVGVGFSTKNDQGYRRVAFIVLDPDTVRYPALATVGLSVRVEVLHEGAPVEDVPVMASTHKGVFESFDPESFIGSCALSSVPEELEEGEEKRGAWSLRVTGVADRTWLLWHAESRWGGSIVVPIHDAILNETARAQASGRHPEWPR